MKKIYITIEGWCNSSGGLKCFDYPKQIPLPRIGELVIFENEAREGEIYGRVVDIRHIITGTVADIKIVIKQE